ncbi:TetR/AcrR family transcriptional regulator [Pseudonocardia pini]|uniref:TetR/AcrR family transcriptional regulator n=1 Tax=Pseudonocardia pini TaxID=2758030 RepID=UPI0015F05977|nr:TetR/AcrR family transcriptional regulator [Pseudonocardia pini]
MSDRAAATRGKLIDATIATLREHGIAGVSARTIAAAGGVNQALVFYHFSSVDTLVGEACLATTRRRVESFGPRLDAVGGFAELVEVAGEISAEERDTGNVRVLAQALAGAQTNPALAEAAGAALRLWTDRVEVTVRRILPGSVLADLFDARELAELVSAAFVGIELTGATGTAPGLTRIAELAAVLDGLGPVARRAVRSALRR